MLRITPFIFIVATVASLTHATATTTAAPEVSCTSQDQLQACATSAKSEALICYDKECACSELAAFEDCYYKYCPGFGGAYGGGIVNSFTCEGTTPVSGFPTASSGRTASGEATESSSGLGGGNTESRVTAAPTSTSTGNSGSTNSSDSNSNQNATTSTNDASKLFASAGVLLGSFISVIALL
ncbi:hypothetical protein VE03_09341 [Pseudogymnoascus sp. 23342-1-I1]|nr:hypothetical protein VE03_09341 [Pseudogymnoascus sp. 23342-1-I1]